MMPHDNSSDGCKAMENTGSPVGNQGPVMDVRLPVQEAGDDAPC